MKLFRVLLTGLAMVIVAGTIAGASPRGQSFTLFFIFALLFLPGALIVAYLLKDSTPSRSTAA